MKTAPILIGAAAAVLIGLPAAAQPKAENNCFWTRDLRNHTVGGEHVLYFDVGGRSVYKVETSDSCLAGASSSDPIVMLNRTGSGQICNKMDLDISVRGARCIVSNMTKLTPAEAAALPKKMKP
ncbi:hypothetical protein [Phenylobacterium sp.]|uniref:hypothetical protein n=1 Tax=Phenylobacterium sp. TaxID=1871053 RepID=UPI002D1AF131|nr:hypothetical protein [Phenylobacterium sp.]HLZ75091.1 hypothetical protein [Phenylobacterium sp.]